MMFTLKVQSLTWHLCPVAALGSWVAGGLCEVVVYELTHLHEEDVVTLVQHRRRPHKRRAHLKGEEISTRLIGNRCFLYLPC